MEPTHPIMRAYLTRVRDEGVAKVNAENGFETGAVQEMYYGDDERDFFLSMIPGVTTCASLDRARTYLQKDNWETEFAKAGLSGLPDSERRKKLSEHWHMALLSNW